MTLVAAAVLLGLILLVLALYAARREAAREVLVGWLERQGVEAEVEFESFDFDGLVGRIRAGPADDPDLVVERVEVDYSLGAPWAPGGWSVTPTRIRLYRPIVKARLREGRLEFGSLDPIVQDFLQRPPQPDRTGPRVLIEQAQVRLITALGDVRALGDAELEGGRLVSLDATAPAARLRDDRLDIRLTSARLRARSDNGRLTIQGQGAVASWASDGLTMDGAAVRLNGELPYPDEAARREGGPVTAEVDFQADALAMDGLRVADGGLAAAFRGEAQGWLATFSLTGAGQLRTSAGAVSMAGGSATGASASVDARTFRLSRDERGVGWRLDGAAHTRAARLSQGDVTARDLTLAFGILTAGANDGGFEAVSRVRLNAGRLQRDDLVLGDARGTFELDARRSGAMLVDLDGALTARNASWTALGPARAGDVPEFATIKRALGAFRLEAPGLAIRTGTPGTVVALTQPARALPASGGAITVTPRRGRLIYSAAAGEAGGGAFDLATTGGGLPEAQVAVPTWRMAGNAIVADMEGRAAFDFGLARDATLDAAGALRIAGGVTTFSASRCTAFTSERLELGENDVVNLTGDLCASGRPLLTIADGWRLDAEARGLRATAPFLGMRFVDVAGPLIAADRGRGLEAEATVQRARVSDTSDPPRFRPMGATGEVTLAGERWDGAFRLADAVHGRRVADLALEHDGRAEIGELRIDARDVMFAEGGLQPSHISPLADVVAKSDAVGEADFTGAFRWTAAGASSEGRFVTEGLDFVSPAGAVTRLSGEVAFDSLAPLTTAPAQTLRVAQIDAFLPLTEATVVFQLAGDVLRIASGDVHAADGILRLEPLEVPLDPQATYGGVLVLDEVQMGELIARTGFADSVQLDARVSGRLPFTVTPDGVTFADGRVAAVQPGRISIAREALSGVEAEGGAPDEAPPGLVEDFAYQAMENLAFQEMSAVINSLPEGRLGVLFHIRGRHDPPQHQEIRLTLGELIRREFMDRQLPLPSGTEVNLTLDSTFNLDQLVGDLMEISRARQGLPEQESPE